MILTGLGLAARPTRRCEAIPSCTCVPPVPVECRQVACVCSGPHPER